MGTAAFLAAEGLGRASTATTWLALICAPLGTVTGRKPKICAGIVGRPFAQSRRHGPERQEILRAHPVLEREVRELRQANEILRKASAYFAQAELDRRFKP